ncbi:hypothetical protein DL769_003886 [Monosporascus sp. CRB-8-3]|nr:hypothetical protein DL769_003886 [Monosporascus sp. CRB-8-3]
MECYCVGPFAPGLNAEFHTRIDIGKPPLPILPVRQTGDLEKEPIDRDSAKLLGEILHNWFGYVSCFGHRSPDLTLRDYDCRDECWQPEKDAGGNTCASPCDVEWEQRGPTRWIGATAVMAAVRKPTGTKAVFKDESTLVIVKKGPGSRTFTKQRG